MSGETKVLSQPSPRRLVILLHGLGGAGSLMLPFGASWQQGLAETRFVAPDAPFSHRYGGRQWFPVDEQVLQPERIEAARGHFDTVISEVLRREGFEDNLSHVAFAGVSQGAIVALDAFVSGRWKIGALVSFAGLLALKPPPAPPGAAPMLLLHGRDDRTIPASASMLAASQLQAAGFDVGLKLYPGLGHTISAEGAADALRFLQTRFTG